jgi:hypothetical protein
VLEIGSDAQASIIMPSVRKESRSIVLWEGFHES